MTTDVQEVLAVWREAERILDKYHARREAAEFLADVRAQAAAMRELYGSLTDTDAAASMALESAALTIAKARAVLHGTQLRIRSREGGRNDRAGWLPGQRHSSGIQRPSR